VVGADGRGERRLTNGAHEETEAHWLDDERVLAQQLLQPPRPGSSRRLVVMPAGGGSPRTVLEGIDYGLPAVSPDGRRVALASVVRPKYERLQLYSARLGGRAKRIASDIVTVHPTWSPDSRWIAFPVADRIDAVRPDGSGRRTLVRIPGREIREVTWSPDGGRIAFVAVGPRRVPQAPALPPIPSDSP
jgi:Tol biopolymer transport system component